MIDAKPADLSLQDIRPRAQEIMKWHALFKNFSPELAERTLRMFAEELDSTKTYFIESDLHDVLDPSQQYLSKIVRDYNNNEFFAFEQLFDRVSNVIQRRNLLDERLKTTTLPEHVSRDSLKMLSWAKTEEELFERLKIIRSAQLSAVKKLDSDSEKVTLQVIDKYRKHREAEFKTTTADGREKMVATLFLKAIAKAMDSQTSFFTPTEAKQFLIAVQQKMFGVGVLMKDGLDGFIITQIVEGGPADRSGLVKLKDKIIAVNGEPVMGIDVSDVVEKIRGPLGTEVVLTVLRSTDSQHDEEKVDITIQRGEVVIKDARYSVESTKMSDGIIVTLKLHSFYQDQESSSTGDLISAFRSVQRENKDQKIKGVLLDLRSNPGGLLTEAVSVTGLFLKKGIVVSVRDENGDIQHLRNMDSSRLWDGPLVVLINRASASASEIVAQTLQDYGRAIVVGDASSFGKGSFQTFTLNPSDDSKINPKGEYKVTRGCYYTPSGRSPQLTGVISDIEIPGPFSEAEVGERFSTYPLATSIIEPCFNDTLSDVPFFRRNEIRKRYLFDLEKPTKYWQEFLPSLKHNSTLRRAANSEYIAYLEKLKNTSGDLDFSENDTKETDYQSQEALSVLIELISLSDKDAATRVPIKDKLAA